MKLQLTDRECEVMELLCAGCSCNTIAKKLVIERCTVSGHFRNIYKKYGLKNNREWNLQILAIRKYLQNKRSFYEQF